MPPESNTTLTVTLADRQVAVARGTVLRDFAAAHAPAPQGEEWVGAFIDNKIADLGSALERDCRVDLFSLRSRDGMRMYQRSLICLLVIAVQETFPDLQVHVNHTLGDGFYCEMVSGDGGVAPRVRLTEDDLARIEATMRGLVEADLELERTSVSVARAREVFTENGHPDKVALLDYRHDKRISLYRCGEELNHFCGYLVPRTGLLQVFALQVCDGGFLLRYPGHADPTTLRDFVWYPKLFSVYREYEEWGKILGLETVTQLNAMIQSGGIHEYIKVAEALHEKKIAQIADMICQAPGRPRVVLISGPSSSGKTTFTKRLAVHLRVNGMRSRAMGLDDFFVDRERTPRDESGDYDFEAFGAIDAPLFATCVRHLLEGEEVTLPHFDFKAGTSVPGHTMTLAEDEILLVEGIHGLNPALLPSVPDGQKFRVFVSALTQLNIDRHNRIPSSDTRMIRRMVRDSQYRGYSAKETIARWPSVRRGEGRNIFPYQEEADVIFNTALTYELGVLRQLALPTLQEIGPEVREHAEARRLIYMLSYFENIDVDEVPRHSLLREFTGGSSFNY